MNDLHPGAIAAAVQLVGAVRDGDTTTAHRILTRSDTHGLHQLTVALAAMVDDTKTTRQLLAWTEHTTDYHAWPQQLSGGDAQQWHQAYMAGDNSPEAHAGHREYRRRLTDPAYKTERDEAVAALADRMHDARGLTDQECRIGNAARWRLLKAGEPIPDHVRVAYTEYMRRAGQRQRDARKEGAA